MEKKKKKEETAPYDFSKNDERFIYTFVGLFVLGLIIKFTWRYFAG